MDDTLKHYGIKRRSGRYPWGSGADKYQREHFKFIADIDNKRNSLGMSDKEIAESLGISTTDLRSKVTLANKEIKKAKMESIEAMHKDGMTNVDIGKELDMSEASVRNYLKKNTNTGNIETAIDNTAEMLKRSIEKNEYIDVGAGVERQIGISKEKLRAARKQLVEEGYVEHKIFVKQISDPSKWTTIQVLTKEKDLAVVNKNKDKIRNLEEWSDDGGLTIRGLEPIKPIGMERIAIRYAEDGGTLKDGLIEMRRGADGLDLGDARYAQVRIATKDGKYLKGMAVYSDDIPNGKDILFNTNKSKTVAAIDVLKDMKDDPANPFGSTIIRQKGHLNIVNEEGTWNTWSDKMSSQFLSKQPVKLVKERLLDTYESLEKERKSIMALTDPVVRKQLLTEFNDGLDAKARDLKAKGLARTKNHVILPFPEMAPNEIYAPNYKNGEKVVLIRHPHGGRFEIPELTVNNKFKKAKDLLQDAVDAVGIHPSQAEKMSGADFDGDTALVIPNNSRKIKSQKMLTQLKNFDNKEYAREHETIKKDVMQIEMGKISNLITDMTIKGASDSEIARATKHSMVVIDSYKHKLDYKQSERDFGISALRTKYQQRIDPKTGRVRKGASTLISRAKNKQLDDGDEIVYTDKRTGEVKVKKVPPAKRHQMDMVDDAFELSSGTPVEAEYASYANKVKAMKNTVTKDLITIPKIKKNRAVAKAYAPEVDSVLNKLNEALLNAPRERQVQLQANLAYYKSLRPGMTKDDRKKLRTQVLSAARSKLIPTAGNKKARIYLTDREWEAAQKGAFSQSKWEEIVYNAEPKRLRELATPKQINKLSSPKLTRARILLDKGYTQAEVAEQMGVSVSTLNENLNK